MRAVIALVVAGLLSGLARAPRARASPRSPRVFATDQARRAHATRDRPSAARALRLLQALAPGTEDPSLIPVRSWLETEARGLYDRAASAAATGATTLAAPLYLEAIHADPSLLAREDHGLAGPARRLLEAAITRSPGQGERWLDLALHHFLVDDMSGCRKALGRAIALFPAGPWREAALALDARLESEAKGVRESQEREAEARSRQEAADEAARAKEQAHKQRLDAIEERYRQETRQKEVERQARKIQEQIGELDRQIRELENTPPYRYIVGERGEITVIPTDHWKVWSQQEELTRRKRDLELDLGNLR